MKDEHAFIKAVHRQLNPDIYIWKINDNYHGGIADAWYAGTEARDLYVEYKYHPKFPVHDKTRIKFKLSDLQHRFLMQMGRREIPALFVMGVENQVICLSPSKLSNYPAQSMTKAEFLYDSVTIKEISNTIGRLLGY